MVTILTSGMPGVHLPGDGWKRSIAGIGDMTLGPFLIDTPLRHRRRGMIGAGERGTTGERRGTIMLTAGGGVAALLTLGGETIARGTILRHLGFFLKKDGAATPLRPHRRQRRAIAKPNATTRTTAVHLLRVVTSATTVVSATRPRVVPPQLVREGIGRLLQSPRVTDGDSAMKM